MVFLRITKSLESAVISVYEEVSHAILSGFLNKSPTDPARPFSFRKAPNGKWGYIKFTI